MLFRNETEEKIAFMAVDQYRRSNQETCGADSNLGQGKSLRADCPTPTGEAAILAELFRYHPPTPETTPKFQAINQAAKNFAEIVLQNCPPSYDRKAAIDKIIEAKMTANASIALNGLSL